MAQRSQRCKKLRSRTLQDYIAHSDHPLIVNFWATFCVPCNKEIPYFQNTVARYKDQGVELILVSLDLPDYYPGKLHDFARKQGLYRENPLAERDRCRLFLSEGRSALVGRDSFVLIY